MISVCIPTFNRAEYLAECLDSIQRQTFKDWEAIVVNDGGTDSTDKLMEYFTKDKRIKYFHRDKNMGIAFTRNEAVKLSEGEYIAVMDSDDIMSPDRLDKQIKKIKGLDFVYSAYAVGDNEARVMQNGLIMPPSKLTVEGVLDGYTAPHVTILAHRECFEDNPYNNSHKVNDDLELVLKWLKSGYKYKRMKDILMMVRMHPKSVSKVRDEQIKKITDQLRKEYA